MKKLLLMFALIMTASCTSETKYGECIGAFDDGDPKLVYEVSTNNVIVAAIFVETIIVPIVVVLDKTRCPVRKKQ